MANKPRKSKKRARDGASDQNGSFPTPKRIKRKEVSASEVCVFTDGGCHSNGAKNAKAGIGVFFGENDPRNVSRGIPGAQTNNRAELSAIIEALRITLDYGQRVLINTDSEYSINGIKGITKIKRNKDLFGEIEELLRRRVGEVDFIKVAGHSGSRDGNYYADRLATKAIST